MAEWMVLGVLAGFSVFDLRWKRVSTIGVAVFGAVALVYRICVGTGVAELFCGFLPGLILLVVSFLTKESVGMGDGLVLCALGIFSGMKQTLAVLGMAFFLCAMLAVLLLVLRRANKKTELPFLPCLCAGYLLCLLW